VEGLVEIFGQGDEVVDPTLKGFREEFSKLLCEFTDVRRVVVLVDDLDRCLPDTVVMTMEAIKLFLSVEKMAFVVAADELPVKLAIARHFDRDERGTRMAADYLEKIVHGPLFRCFCHSHRCLPATSRAAKLRRAAPCNGSNYPVLGTATQGGF
jgi:hypothetical protein